MVMMTSAMAVAEGGAVNSIDVRIPDGGQAMSEGEWRRPWSVRVRVVMVMVILVTIVVVVMVVVMG